ncbi:hypothetical protein AB0K68_19790 [Streptomyces sp. NPDC050698]
MTGCASDDGSLDYQTDYSNHRPLRAVVYPSTGSLETVQKAVWRLADGDTDGLASLAVDDTHARATARNWVIVYAKSGQIKEIQARIGEDGSRGLTLAEPDPAEAMAKPTWVPPKPGGSKSRTSGAPSGG